MTVEDRTTWQFHMGLVHEDMTTEERKACYGWAQIRAMQGAARLVVEHDMADPDDEDKFLEVTKANWRWVYEQCEEEVPDIPEEINWGMGTKGANAGPLFIEVKVEDLPEERQAEIHAARAELPPD